MARTKDIYELLENNNKEIMVLIYTLGNQPENPKFILNENNRCLEIYRNKKDLQTSKSFLAQKIFTDCKVCKRQSNTKSLNIFPTEQWSTLSRYLRYRKREKPFQNA